MSDYDEDDYFDNEEEDYRDDDYEEDEEEDEDYEDEEGWEKDETLNISEQLNPSDYKRGFGGENIGTVREGKGGKYSDPYNTYRSQIFLKIREKEYTEDIYQRSDEIVAKIPKTKLLLMNIDVLIPSLLFLSIYKKKVTSENIEYFLKDYKSINPFDFVRYIRYMMNQ